MHAGSILCPLPHQLLQKVIPLGYVGTLKWLLPQFLRALAISVPLQAVVKNADMSEDMQQDAIDCASQALEKFNIEKDIAAFIKKEECCEHGATYHK